MAFGLYLHYPFCDKICTYCDYHKQLHEVFLEQEYFKALITETKLAAQNLPENRQVTSIYIGGGTPSLANPDLLSGWMTVLREHFDIGEDIESSLECNPEHVTLEQLQFFQV